MFGNFEDEYEEDRYDFEINFVKWKENMDFDFFVVELKDMERLLLFLVLDLIYKGIDCEYKFIF